MEPLPAAEYGAMPARYKYANSQPVTRSTVESETMPTLETVDAAAADDTSASAKPTRRPILMRDKFDGVDSDDETDSEEEGVPGGGDDDEESDEDRPLVVGEIEPDMEEEEEDFLKFARETLGISEGTWGDIIKDRHTRGGQFLASPKSSRNSLDDLQRSSLLH